MRKYLLMLSTCMLSFQTLTANVCGNACPGWPSSSEACSKWPSSFNIDFGGGFRKDKFEWNIGSGAEDEGPEDVGPNVLSELQWKDLRIAQIGGCASYVSCRNYAIRIEGQYGHIYHGKVLDSDFDSDDRTDLYSLSEHKAGKGHVYDLNAAAGYRVTSTYGRFVATPLIGYSEYGQYLHIYGGRQIFFRNLPPIYFPDVTNLNSTYTTRWFGPWIGMDFEARVERCAYLFGGFEWHMLSYRAHGKWNLRRDIGPFYHKAYGMGYVANLGGKWEIWNNWAIGIAGSYRNFRTRHGHEDLTVIDPVLGRFTLRSRFNQAKWHSYSVSAIISWRF